MISRYQTANVKLMYNKGYDYFKEHPFPNSEIMSSYKTSKKMPQMRR